MKHILITTIAAVVLLVCGISEPNISILDAAYEGKIEVIKQYLAAGADVNARDAYGMTSSISHCKHWIIKNWVKNLNTKYRKHHLTSFSDFIVTHQSLMSQLHRLSEIREMDQWVHL